MQTCLTEVDIPISIPGGLYAIESPRAARDHSRRGGDGLGREAAGASGALDCVRAAFWEAYRHLFPPHSLAAQTPQGAVVISWFVCDEPGATYPYATPVLLRFDPSLLDAMWRCDAAHRLRIARHHEATVREGLRGYDPFAQFPNARVVTLG
jgi:hypothetical protein